jgi:hypothetical protein
VLFKVAKSFKFIGKYGIFRLLNLSTATYHTNESLIVLSKIIYLYVILKFTENTFIDKKYLTIRAIGFLRSFKKLTLDKYIQDYLKKVIRKILNNNYVSISDKNKIKSAFFSLNIY